MDDESDIVDDILFLAVFVMKRNSMGCQSPVGVGVGTGVDARAEIGREVSWCLKFRTFTLGLTSLPWCKPA